MIGEIGEYIEKTIEMVIILMPPPYRLKHNSLFSSRTEIALAVSVF
jgi:hypothetical protein